VLGVQREATDKEIKMAYFKLAKMYHPDVEDQDKKSDIDFEKINEAYRTLKETKTRKLYDRTGLSVEEQKQGFPSAESMEEEVYKDLENRRLDFTKLFQQSLRLFKYDMSLPEDLLEQPPVAVNEYEEPLYRKIDFGANI
jgi:DnaJ-class molecular chaperone